MKESKSPILPVDDDGAAESTAIETTTRRPSPCRAALHHGHPAQEVWPVRAGAISSRPHPPLPKT
jgi:hypothetical protein